jgi:hypothetical protein
MISVAGLMATGYLVTMDNPEKVPLPNGRTLKIERGRKSAGQILRFTILTRTGRIVGMSEMLVPLMEGYSLEGKLGTAAAAKIEETLKAVAIGIADAVERKGTPEGEA